MIQYPLRLSFTGGEISPWASSRLDLDMYSRSASSIQNFIITPFGGLTRRPGFKYIDQAATTSGNIKLVPFQYSTGLAYILEFSANKIRFFYNGQLVKNDDGTAYALSTSWSDPSLLQVNQINDVMYICTGSSPVMRLERVSHRSWRIVDIDWKNLPWRHNYRQSSRLTYTNTGSTNGGYPLYTLANSSSAWVGGSYGGKDYVKVTTVMGEVFHRLVGSAVYADLINRGLPSLLDNPVNTYHVGSIIYYEVSSGEIYFYTCICLFKGKEGITRNPSAFPTYFSPGVAVSSAVSVHDKWEFRTQGTWRGEWILRKSYDNGASWITERNFRSDADSNYITTGDESEEPCLMRVFLSYANSGAKPTTTTFRALSCKVDHLFEITTQVSGGTYYARKLNSQALPDTGYTYEWSVSAFGAKYGYPAAITWHQNRLVFAGTPSQPQTLWLSVTDDFHNFKLGSNDSDALELTVSASSQNKIKWLHSQQKIFFGTSEGEWTLDSSDGRALSPSNARFICHSHQGGERFSILPMENSLLFVQRGGTKIRELSYDINNDGYATTDMNLFADHILSEGVLDLSLYRDNIQMVWVAKKDGEVASMTWIPGQSILAWNRQTLSGNAQCLSIASLYNNSESQELWAVIQRGSTRTIEMLGNMGTLPQSSETINSSKFPIYLDSWAQLQKDSSSIITLPAQMAGAAVTIYPRYKPHLAFSLTAPSTGKVKLTDHTTATDTYWIAGFTFESHITTTAFDFPETVGRLKNHVSTQVSILHSHPDIEYGGQGDLWFSSQSPLSYTGDSTNSATTYYSGYISLPQSVINETTPKLSLRTSSPHPLNVLSIIPRISYSEDQ